MRFLHFRVTRSKHGVTCVPTCAKQKLGAVRAHSRNWVRTTENEDCFTWHPSCAGAGRRCGGLKSCLPYSSLPGALTTHANSDANHARTFSFTVRSFSTYSDCNLSAPSDPPSRARARARKEAETPPPRSEWRIRRAPISRQMPAVKRRGH